MGFVGSRAFYVSGAIGLLLVATFLATPVVFPGLVERIADPCGYDGADAVLTDGGHSSQAPADRLEVCISVGSVRIEAHDGPGIEVAVHGDVGNEVSVHRDGATLHVEQTLVQRTSWWFGGDSDVHVTVQVPRTAMSFNVTADVADLSGSGLNGTGANAWRVDVGDIDVTYTALAGATVLGTADVGEVTFTAPEGDYEFTGSTDVGDIGFDVPGMTVVSRDSDAAGEQLTARTPGFDTADDPIVVTIRIDVGDGRLRVN